MTTRDRLVRAATKRFAEHGYHNVSVRDLCRDARANVAAVNYHFGGKLGLYREVVGVAIEAIRSASAQTIFAAQNRPPVERLARYVNAYVRTIAGDTPPSDPARAAWVHQLLAHEGMEPTPLAPWIAEQALMPRIRYLSALVAELMHRKPTDRRVHRCVLSIQAQCLFYAAPNKFRDSAFPDWPPTRRELAAAADHIVEFSLAGIRRFAKAR
ncbi:MAG: TetR/AcrR family transcriptional regulator [Gemmatimonadaceae bacterium]